MSDKATDRTAKIVALLREKVRLEPWHRRSLYCIRRFVGQWELVAAYRMVQGSGAWR